MERLEGTRIEWEIRNDTLYLEGSGPMKFRYDPDKDRLDIPWYYLDFTRVEIGGGITTIGTEAFHTSDLVYADIPGTIESIGPEAFCQCKDLKEVVIGDGIRKVGEFAFYECASLEKVTLGNGLNSLGDFSFSICPNIRFVECPPELTDIGRGAFYKDTGLERISLSKGLTHMDDNPFAYCSSLREFDVDPGNPHYVFEDGALLDRDRFRLVAGTAGFREIPSDIHVIGNAALVECGLKEVILPENLTALGLQAFENSRVEELDVGKLYEIPADAFCDCRELRKVNLGTCGNICSGAFRGCTSLKEITLPDTLEVLGEEAFAGSGLEEITIPLSLVDICYGAFYECASLKKAVMPISIGDEGDYFPPHTEIEYLDD